MARSRGADLSLRWASARRWLQAGRRACGRKSCALLFRRVSPPAPVSSEEAARHRLRSPQKFGGLRPCVNRAAVRRPGAAAILDDLHLFYERLHPPSGACSAAFPTRRRASGSCRSRWKGSHRRSPRRPAHGAVDRLTDVEGARRLSSEIGSADKRLVAFEDPAKGGTAPLARLLGPFARLRLDRAGRMNGPRLRRRRREGNDRRFSAPFPPLELFPEGFGGESGTFPMAFRPAVSIRCCSIWTRISK